jgi:hypothetical protein
MARSTRKPKISKDQLHTAEELQMSKETSNAKSKKPTAFFHPFEFRISLDICISSFELH